MLLEDPSISSGKLAVSREEKAGSRHGWGRTRSPALLIHGNAVCGQDWGSLAQRESGLPESPGWGVIPKGEHSEHPQSHGIIQVRREHRWLAGNSLPPYLHPFLLFQNIISKSHISHVFQLFYHPGFPFLPVYFLYSSTHRSEVCGNQKQVSGTN